MNIRALTLRYLGWCLGVKSAAMFIPNKEISGRSLILITVSITSLLVTAIAIQTITKPKEATLLIVTIYDVVSVSPVSKRVTYPDETFDETFNYSKLKDKHIEFNIPFEAKFATSNEIETQIFEFESLDDVWLFLENHSTPRIVIGFADWLTNGTFEEVFKRFHGYDPSERGEWPGPPEDISLWFGRMKTGQCYFEVIRAPSPASDIEKYVNGIEGIYVEKRFASDESRSSAVWILYIKLNDAPPFSAVFCKYPYYSPR